MSNFNIYRKICLKLPESEETFPFGPKDAVMKVNGKIFAILSGDEISLKCNPERALDYRDMYEGVKEGYHLNKKHWNTVKFDSDVNKAALMEMIIHSYKCVTAKMSKSVREVLWAKLEDQKDNL